MKVIFSAVMLLVSAVSTDLQASSYCGELKKVNDYKDSAQREYLEIVEQYHFTPSIENLRYGITSTLGGDLSYTLMLFPNHHRALVALGKLSLRDKTLKPEGSKYSIWCFFDRAIRYKPNDAIVRMIFGNYLLKAGEADKAAEQLQIAVDLQPEDATINYNLGLLYMQKKNYKQARTYAKKAYELGFPLPGLKNQLVKAGKWDGD